MYDVFVKLHVDDGKNNGPYYQHSNVTLFSRNHFVVATTSA